MVAGGAKDVQTCYLHSSLDKAASAGGSASGSSSAGGTAVLRQSGGQVQYNAANTSNRKILESGTKDPKALPASLYGCPYPATSGGDCKAPPSCNCYGGVCYGTC